MMNNFKEQFEILEQNKELQNAVNQYLIKNGVSSKLKGFQYFSDIATIGLVNKKYSKTFMKDIFPFIAHKYNIKEFSVQRQLRYTFTIACERKIRPEDLYQCLWFDYKMGKLEI